MKSFIPAAIFIVSMAACSQPKPNNEMPVYTKKDSIVDNTRQASSTNANLNNTEPQKQEDQVDLQSLIEGCDITFDENFAPIATIKLHNITGKRIDQIQFRFTFTNYERMNNAQIGLIEDGENSSYVNMELMLTPPDYKTVTIQIPDPKRKNIDKPNVYVTKIRYFDGSIQTDNR